jgi:hypothetical protein
VTSRRRSLPAVEAASRWRTPRDGIRTLRLDGGWKYGKCPSFSDEVIRLTAGHQAKVEEEPEVRKSGLTAVGVEAILILQT